jgi:hypothetical protein
VSFFDPLPPEPPPVEGQWAPPAWDRPSEGTRPALLPVNAVIHQTDGAVIAVESLGVYPNGFTVHVTIMVNPHHTRTVGRPMYGGGLRRMPRVGVRFPDGRTGGRGPNVFHSDAPKDAEGFPTEPVVRFVGGGGGGSQGWRFSAWVYPLPPDGPLEIFVSLPAAGLDEGRVTVDGSAVREAAHRAQVIWT